MDRPIGQLMPRLFGLPVQGWIGCLCMGGSGFLKMELLSGTLLGLAIGLFAWGAADGSAERLAAKAAEARDSHA